MQGWRHRFGIGWGDGQTPAVRGTTPTRSRCSGAGWPRFPWGLTLLSLVMVLGLGLWTPSRANPALFIAYPPVDHETIAAQIFFIGTAPASVDVQINGQAVGDRSVSGHFAPSWPLAIGENVFTITAGTERLTRRVTRLDTAPPVATGLAFAPDSLQPAVDVVRRPDELLCFSAIAPPAAEVSIELGAGQLRLQPTTTITALPANSAVLTRSNQPEVVPVLTQYDGCAIGSAFLADATALTSAATLTIDLGYPRFTLNRQGETLTQTGVGRIGLLTSQRFQVATVHVPAGAARTGPSTNYSRLTPLPQGTQAVVVGREGEWLRLDYGGWIRANETTVTESGIPPRSQIRSITSRQIPGWTEIIFPLQVPVPISIEQRDRSLTLTLHNTTAQTDTIYFSADPVVQRLDWQPSLTAAPEYTFHLRSAQPWGYTLRYEDTSLVLALRHPPDLQPSRDRPLQGMSILLDPGHGSDEDLGARGPTGYPEKDVTLILGHLLRDQLSERGATVFMTRDADIDLYPNDRAAQIQQLEPTIALSLHYNALPDDGDALNTAGVSAFWYHAQAHSLATFLHDYLVDELDRPSDGVYWNNLALTRPAVAPSVLLELGFMINPTEFEWIIDPQAQVKLAQTLAEGIVAWTQQAIANPVP